MPALRSTPKIVGIVGSRRRDVEADFVACWEAFDEVYIPGDRVVLGGCPRGGDRFAEIIAKRRGLTITVHCPDWDGIGRGAGFVRNTRIAEIYAELELKKLTGMLQDKASGFYGKMKGEQR